MIQVVEGGPLGPACAVHVLGLDHGDVLRVAEPVLVHDLDPGKLLGADKLVQVLQHRRVKGLQGGHVVRPVDRLQMVTPF